MEPRPLADRQTIARVLDTIVRARDPERVVLFGSHAEGTDTWDSDVDLLVVMETRLGPVERVLDIRRLFAQAPCALDILVYTPAEADYWSRVPSSFLHDILAHGRVLYERAPAGAGRPVGRAG
ncbi:MAG: nucleotidyltransferase domain-containing protein [Candidatus Latescibacterota bacterium]